MIDHTGFAIFLAFLFAILFCTAVLTMCIPLLVIGGVSILFVLFKLING